MSFRARLYVLLCFTLVAVAGVFSLPRMPQDSAYHLFADSRALLGIPNFFNVVSNLAFLAAGFWGLAQVLPLRRAAAFCERSERWPYIAFFLGFILTCFGSACYHWMPQNRTLAWDRAAMAVVCMGILAATLNDRIGRRSGTFWLCPMLGFGISSVIYWHITERSGSGDLRPYVIVQFFTLAALLLLFALFPARYTHSGWLLAGGAAYLIAKGFEIFDRQTFALLNVSGHTLKHLAAASAALCIAHMLRRRTAVSG